MWYTCSIYKRNGAKVSQHPRRLYHRKVVLPMGTPKYTTNQRISAFWEKVDKSGGIDACWIWTAGLRNQYGNFWDGMNNVGAHVFSYTLAHGFIPNGLYVCHSCDNPRCVNPAHLWLGTNADNTHDRDLKGRNASGDRNGSRLHPESVPKGDSHYSRLQPERLARGDRHGSKTHPEGIRVGETNGRAKLTDKDIQKIRQKYATGGVSHSELATEYQVAKSLIGRILRRESWKHVY